MNDEHTGIYRYRPPANAGTRVHVHRLLGVAIRHEWRKVNGVRLHCAIAGDGPLVVLLHGFPEFWFSWRYQIAALANRFTMVAPDLRGYNQSDKPARIADYTLPILVQDVVALIRSFGRERAIVGGHDWGGVVAWELALQRPQAVEKLLIFNAPHPRLFIQNLLTNPRQVLRSWYVGPFQLPWLPERLLSANDYAAIERMLREASGNPGQLGSDEVAAYKRAAAQPGALTGGLNYYRANARRGVLRYIDHDPVLQMPVLVVWGEQDIALGRELNDGLERYVPDLRLHYIPNAGHWVQQEQPEPVNRYIAEFLIHE